VNDEQLEAVLASVGAHLEVADSRAPSVAPARHRRRQNALRWARPLSVAAAIVAVAAAAIVAVAPARRAVGGWLHVGRTELHADTDLAVPIGNVPSFLDALPPISPSVAADRLGAPLPDLAATPLGPPAALLSPPEGGVIAAWNAGETTLWMVNNVDAAVWFEKVVTTADQVTELPELGEGGGGVLISGEHLLGTPRRRIAADNTVLWTVGNIAYRLESRRSGGELVTLAESIARS
jgi:hypothetical protein